MQTTLTPRTPSTPCNYNMASRLYDIVLFSECFWAAQSSKKIVRSTNELHYMLWTRMMCMKDCMQLTRTGNVVKKREKKLPYLIWVTFKIESTPRVLVEWMNCGGERTAPVNETAPLYVWASMEWENSKDDRFDTGDAQRRRHIGHAPKWKKMWRFGFGSGLPCR